ncbi:hypothetical protein K438DRAFT_1990912 [Mycena galopus ATCC 62051]|nr:hypothetical protein K438DRAFT_1990912 [Mycena galopus ATCC 62051]
MSSENIPILAATIPAFELFSSAGEAMKADGDLAEENVASIIAPGLDLAMKYYKKLKASNAYIVAMFINPSIRMEWIKKNWSTRDQAASRAAILAKRLLGRFAASHPLPLMAEFKGADGVISDHQRVN